MLEQTLNPTFHGNGMEEKIRGEDDLKRFFLRALVHELSYPSLPFPCTSDLEIEFGWIFFLSQSFELDLRLKFCSAVC